jgi:Flp pilus assembly protein TadG
MTRENIVCVKEGSSALGREIPGWFLPFRCSCEANGREERLRRHCGEEGATLVEFALSAMVMLTLLFGTIEAGLAAYSYNFTSEAARDAVRYAIVRGANCHLETSAVGFGCGADNAAIQSHTQGLGYPGINGGSIRTTTIWYTVTSGPTAWTTVCSTNTFTLACSKPGNAVKVTVNYPFTVSVPFVPLGTINMSNSSMMVISN